MEKSRPVGKKKTGRVTNPRGLPLGHDGHIWGAKRPTSKKREQTVEHSGGAREKPAKETGQDRQIPQVRWRGRIQNTAEIRKRRGG